MTEAVPQQSWITSVVSHRDGTADVLAVCGVLFTLGAIGLTIYEVVALKQKFDTAAYGLMVLQIIGALGGGIGGREWLKKGPPPPGQAAPPVSTAP